MQQSLQMQVANGLVNKPSDDMRALPQLGMRTKPSLSYKHDDLVQMVPVAGTLLGVSPPTTHDIVFAAVKEAAVRGACYLTCIIVTM